jgi:hypothetical protein
MRSAQVRASGVVSPAIPRAAEDRRALKFALTMPNCLLNRWQSATQCIERREAQ